MSNTNTIERSVQERVADGLGVGLALEFKAKLDKLPIRKASEAPSAEPLKTTEGENVAETVDTAAVTAAQLAAELEGVAESIVSAAPTTAVEVKGPVEVADPPKVADVLPAVVETDSAEELKRTLQRANILAQSLKAQGLEKKAGSVIQEVFGTAPVATAELPKEAPRPEIVHFSLGQLARMDLLARMLAAPQKTHHLRIDLDGDFALFVLSVEHDQKQGKRVHLRALKATGKLERSFFSIRKDTKRGFEFYQDELYGYRDLSDSRRSKSTEFFRELVAKVDERKRERPRNRQPQRREHGERAAKAQTK